MTDNTQTESPTESPKRRGKDDQSISDSSSNVQLGVFKLNESVELPEFKTEQSACFDLAAFASEGDSLNYYSFTNGNKQVRRVTDRGITVHTNERILIPTGLVFDIPEGYCLEIYPRSGTSYKQGLTLNNCTAIIDSDYVEEVFISIHNTGPSCHIQSGERIAQAKLVQLVKTNVTELSSKPKTKTSRKSGFGSTGKF